MSSTEESVIDFTAGAVTGALGCVVGNPFVVVKTRIQSNHGAHSTLAAFRNLIQSDGWRGVFVGIDAALPRVIIGSATQLGSYGFIKRNLSPVTIPTFPGLTQERTLEDVPNLLMLVSSLVAGLVVTTAISPFDTVSTRLYLQEGAVTRSSSAMSVAQDIIRKEGVATLWKGWSALYYRIAPSTTVTLIIWEHVNNFAQRWLLQNNHY